MDKESILKIVSGNIRIERLKRHYTQDHLAEIAKITQKYLSKIEEGKSNPSIVVVIKICKALEIDLNTIYKI